MHSSAQIYRSRIDRVMDHVTNNLDRALPLDELAAVAYFSPFHFHRVFMAVTGEALNHFTSRMRLEKAARLLRYSGSPVAAIALDCGFSSAATLTRAFKQRYSVPPGAYRSRAGIQNSKMGKDLSPETAYHCGTSAAELEARFPVTIRQFPERRVAYIRVTDAYRDGVVLQAFRRLADWAEARGLLQTEQVFGMSIDDPVVTPREKYRYEVCITLPDGFEMDKGGGPATMVLPACKYAIATVSGDFNLVAAVTSYLFGTWLINSKYEPEHLHGLELFRDNSRVCDWSHFELDLCIPVKALKKY